jgi:hypothetical protein
MSIYFDLRNTQQVSSYTQVVINLLFCKPMAEHDSQIRFMSLPSFCFSIRQARGVSPGKDDTIVCAVRNNALHRVCFFALPFCNNGWGSWRRLVFAPDKDIFSDGLGHMSKVPCRQGKAHAISWRAAYGRPG